MSDREARIGLNQAVFREVNERIEDLATAFELKSEPLDLICECADATCVERISMTYTEYEELRSDPQQFAVYPGHEDVDIEDIVDRRGGYDVVKKNEGIPERIAEQTNPREPG
jgi:hypothetical protein